MGSFFTKRIQLTGSHKYFIKSNDKISVMIIMQSLQENFIDFKSKTFIDEYEDMGERIYIQPDNVLYGHCIKKSAKDIIPVMKKQIVYFIEPVNYPWELLKIIFTKRGIIVKEDF